MLPCLQAVDHISQQHEAAPVYAAGYSLGSMILAKALTEPGGQQLITPEAWHISIDTAAILFRLGVRQAAGAPDESLHSGALGGIGEASSTGIGELAYGHTMLLENG